MHRSLSHALLRQDAESRVLQQSTPRSTTSLPQSPHQVRCEAPAWREFLKTRHEDHMPGAHSRLRTGTPHGVQEVVATPTPRAATAEATAANADGTGRGDKQAQSGSAGATGSSSLSSHGSEILLTAVFARPAITSGRTADTDGMPGTPTSRTSRSRHSMLANSASPRPPASPMTGADPEVAAAAQAAALEPQAGSDSGDPYDETKMALLEQGHRVNSLTFNQWVRRCPVATLLPSECHSIILTVPT